MYLYYLTFSSVVLIISAHQDIVFPCITPNNEYAFCVSLFCCPVLLKSLGTLDPSAIEFVKQSTCLNNYNPRDLKVCCGTYENFAGYQYPLMPILNISTTSVKPLTTTSENPTQKPDQQNLTATHRDFVKRKLLPPRTYCGLQHTDDRFYNDTATALDEFPWLVDLPFLDDEDEEFRDRCTGVLISNRYVLTIGTCANSLERVRLGQYHTNTTVSCLDNPDIPECTEPKYYVKVEEEIHRNNGSISQYDFALLRLAEKVSYSDFVRPICLPFKEPGDPENPEALILTGWGALEENQQVNKKKLAYTKIPDLDKCYKLDSNGLKSASSNVTVVCLEPKEKEGEFACTGDEGGPLMFTHHFQWFAEALLTKVYDDYDESKVTGMPTNLTHDSCSNKLPISGIKITSDILNWIMDNMRR